MHRVDWASLSARVAYASLPEDDPRRDELDEISFQLVEEGVVIPGARPTIVRLGNQNFEGYSIVLMDGNTMLTYMEHTDRETGEPVIKIASLVFLG